MTYDGEPIVIQNACVNRALVFCKIAKPSGDPTWKNAPTVS